MFSNLVDGGFVLNRSVWVTLWSLDSWYNVFGTAFATESTRTDHEDAKLSRKNLLLGFVEHVHCNFKISDLKILGFWHMQRRDLTVNYHKSSRLLVENVNDAQVGLQISTGRQTLVKFNVLLTVQHLQVSVSIN